MKRIILCLLAVFSAFTVKAQEISVAIDEIVYGNTWGLSVNYSGDVQTTAFQFDISFSCDEPLEFVSADVSTLLADDQVITAHQVASHTIRVMGYSPTSQPFTSISGTLTRILFTCPFATSYDGNVTVSNVYVSDINGNETQIPDNQYKVLHPLYKYVDGNLMENEYHVVGTDLTNIAPWEKEGHTFINWSLTSDSMIEGGVVANAIFSINSYLLTYLVDDEVYEQFSVEYAQPISVIAEPSRDNFSFSGWQNVPSTMPAQDWTIYGYFSDNPLEWIASTGTHRFNDWASSNQGQHGTTDEQTIRFKSVPYTRLSFDYSVSSESSCDYLRVYLDGSQLISYSGSVSSSFQTEFDSEAIHTLRYVYSKDGSVDRGDDTGRVFNIVVNHPRLGDVNNDGSITSGDIVCEVNRMMNRSNSYFLEPYADMNGDGDITIADVVRVINLALVENPYLAPRRTCPQEEEATIASDDEISLEPAAPSSVPLTLNIGGGKYSALQFDVQMPVGCELKSVSLPADAVQMGVRTAQLSDGAYRVILYGDGGKTFSMGNNDLMLNIVTGQPELERQTMDFSNVVVSTAEGDDRGLEDMSVGVDYSSAPTSVKRISDTSTRGRRYDIAGRQWTTYNAHGIVIENAKKFK